jgi:hypothetical protein
MSLNCGHHRRGRFYSVKKKTKKQLNGVNVQFNVMTRHERVTRPQCPISNKIS